jgi:multiple sugar transport system ATP-binding protein
VEDALTCELDGRVRTKTGDALTLSAPADVCYLFDDQDLAFPRRISAERSLAA